LCGGCSSPHASAYQAHSQVGIVTGEDGRAAVASPQPFPELSEGYIRCMADTYAH
jgi:hypothetical protein